MLQTKVMISAHRGDEDEPHRIDRITRFLLAMYEGCRKEFSNIEHVHDHKGNIQIQLAKRASLGFIETINGWWNDGGEEDPTCTTQALQGYKGETIEAQTFVTLPK